jgi:hypothetical protein
MWTRGGTVRKGGACAGGRRGQIRMADVGHGHEERMLGSSASWEVGTRGQIDRAKACDGVSCENAATNIQQFSQPYWDGSSGGVCSHFSAAVCSLFRQPPRTSSASAAGVLSPVRTRYPYPRCPSVRALIVSSPGDSGFSLVAATPSINLTASIPRCVHRSSRLPRQ